MLSEENLRMLNEMGLSGMADSYKGQMETPGISQLSFDDRLGFMITQEKDVRDDRKLTRLLAIAKFRFPSAHIDNILWSDQTGRARPGLDRSYIYQLRECEWVRRAQFCLITGLTGTGKSYLGCALGQAACKRGFKVRFASVSSLLEQLSLARHDGTYPKLVLRLQQTQLLILDDLGTRPLDTQMSSDLLDIMEDRYDAKATIVTSQYPVGDWHSLFENPTIADAIMDRLIHHSHRIDLTGPTIRNMKPEQRNGSVPKETKDPQGPTGEKPNGEPDGNAGKKGPLDNKPPKR